MVLIDQQSVSLTGTHAYEVANTHLAGRTVLIRLARRTSAAPTLWPAGVVLSAAFSTSGDAGASWRNSGGFEAIGGVHVARTGTDMSETTFRCPIPENTNRVRAQFSVSGTCATFLTIEII